MIENGKIKVNRSFAFIILSFIVLFEGNYWALLSILVGQASIRYLLWIAALILCCVILRGKFKKNIIIVPWIAYFILVVFRNQELANGEYINTYRIVLCLMTLFIATQNERWTKCFPKLLVLVGFPNVVATILFYINNDIYEKFIRSTYRSYQSGTANGLYGYRAGIADHYSQNGTYITMIILVFASLLLISAITKKKRKYIVPVLVLAIVALIMTEKRAHLLFSIATLLVIYLIGNSERVSKKAFKLLIAIIVVLTVGGFFADQIPMIQNVLVRFESVGSDSNITKRFLMWTLAINRFWKSPILGNGFLGFMFNSANTQIITDASSGCHNMYIQFLSECGLVGMIIFLACIISSLYATMRNMKRTLINPELDEYRGTIVSSMAIQIFTLMYGMTGNPIYDRTFNFYILAVAVNLAIYMARKDCINSYT